MKTGDILLHGHTHVLRADEKEHILIWNPGSVSIPKEGNPPTYAILETDESGTGIFCVLDFEGNTVKEMNI